MKKNFYVTTPIYYPSARLHLGHAYTTIAADVVKKYREQEGYDVFYLTGTDEHGEKLEIKARENNMEPKAYIDNIVADIKVLWEKLEIENDKFIRTTDEQHKTQVQAIFDRLLKQEDIYKGEYEGLYCTSCESFFTESQLTEGKCPDCGNDVKLVKEESYFFKCSKYVDRLMKHFEENPEFILPISRKNELINSFIKPGLQDLAVSRTSFTWGIPVKGDEKHVIYVWIDALSNYITALDYMDQSEAFEKFWPANVQLVGKEIIRFHAIYWPMILMALDLPLPKQIFAHGWLLMDSDKMSKSKGNVIYPEFLIDNYGVDTIRYYLMREVPFGDDGQFTPETYVNRINNDLANDLGNLVNRTIAMTNKYFAGEVKAYEVKNEHSVWLNRIFKEQFAKYQENMEKLQFSKGLENIWLIISSTNKYIDLTSPWVLAKDENSKEELEAVMYELLNAIKNIAIIIQPFMKNTARKINEQINVENDFSFDQLLIRPNTFKVVEKASIIFPRLEKEEEILKIRTEMESHATAAKAKLTAEKEQEESIEFEDFLKVEMKVGQILECKLHENAKKLLVSQVDMGGSVKQIVSGIAEVYKPEELIGKKVIVVNNLKPVKLRGEESAGMILCSGSKKKIRLVEIDQNVEVGSEIA